MLWTCSLWTDKRTHLLQGIPIDSKTSYFKHFLKIFERKSTPILSNITELNRDDYQNNLDLLDFQEKSLHIFGTKINSFTWKCTPQVITIIKAVWTVWQVNLYPFHICWLLQVGNTIHPHLAFFVIVFPKWWNSIILCLAILYNFKQNIIWAIVPYCKEQWLRGRLSFPGLITLGS